MFLINRSIQKFVLGSFGKQANHGSEIKVYNVTRSNLLRLRMHYFSADILHAL